MITYTGTVDLMEGFIELKNEKEYKQSELIAMEIREQVEFNLFDDGLILI